MEVAEKSYYDSLDRNCYMHITLTDEEEYTRRGTEITSHLSESYEIGL